VGLKSALSNLPDRNPFFTGREDVLAQLQKALAGQRRAALSGLGGVGKTETALEYAHQHFGEYDYTFWTTANSREALLSGYVSVAGLLKLPLSDARDQTLAVDAVKRWLTSNLGWLLILDNADDLGMAREFIPPGKNGHLLLTTRAWAVGPLARFVEIQKMGTEEAMLFLLRRARYIAEDALLDTATEADQTAAKKIVMQLDGLPLALDQAAAYIEETACGLSDYLKLYRHRAPELLGRRGALVPGHSAPVASTWALSFKNIEQANPAAAELLRFCAFMHPNGIPEEVFSEGAPELGPILGPAGKDAFALDGAISAILKYSLLCRDPDTHTLEIHRLVQAALKQGVDENTQRPWAERAVRAVNRAFPSVEFSNWPRCERLLAQAHACAELIKQWGFEFPEAARLLNDTGFYMYERGRYTDSKPLYQQALEIRKKVLGTEHPDVATSLNDLGMLYEAQGQYAQAEPLLEQALAIREHVLGTEHNDVAESLRGLALLYADQGQYAKAEPLYKQALAIREKALDPEDPKVATSLNNLAGVYHNQGQYAKAEPLCRRALVIREKTLGPQHPRVATSLCCLAALYHNQGQYAKAEPLYQRALAIQENALGSKHPDVARNLYCLAALYHNQGQYAKAESLYQQALAIRENALGPEHPDVATVLENYALLLRKMDRPEEAEPLESRARVIREKPR
jgi:tetratricopeptide (TPR) repeat protein